jgi:branched-chain amino acid transport system ATP-binding protein
MRTDAGAGPDRRSAGQPGAKADAPLLEVVGATRRFAGLVAVDQVSFEVPRGELTSIIGPNGAGKTTLFNMLTGQLAVSAGEIRFAGRSVNAATPHERARMGMGRTFQIARPLLALNALENVMVGAFLRHPALVDAEARAIGILEQIGLVHRALHRAGELTLSERRRLEVARALALEPAILLLDEVMAGLNASETAQAIDLVKRLHAQGLTILIIEHNLTVVRSISERVIVLHHGALLANGPVDEVLNAPRVVEAYLGGRREWKPS